MRLPRLSQRLTTGLLIASVCLNLFAVAFFGARLIWQDRRHGLGPGPGFGLVQRAPDEARPVLRAAFDAHKETFQQHFGAVRAAASEIGRLLESGETDPAQLEPAFLEMRLAFDEVEILTHQVIIATLPELSAEERAAWGEQWMRDPRQR
ncbi:MAG: periplasmic heavy metal sensor [Alphaproteobacteria bacterium]